MTFEQQREKMVKTQLITRGIRDERVLHAMRTVPRHLFLDSSTEERAYDDMALPIGHGQTMSQPYMVAVMTEHLELKGDERVLEIGTGSGYQAAILAELSKEVFTIDRIQELTDKAIERFHAFGIGNIHAKTANGTFGWPDESPFDRIIITAAAPEFPSVCMEQLAREGIGIAPVGDKFAQQLLKVRKRDSTIDREYHVPCIFVPLIGRYGWEE